MNKALQILLFVLVPILGLGQDALKRNYRAGVQAGVETGVLLLESGPITSKSSIGIGYSVQVDFIEYTILPILKVNFGVGFAQHQYKQIIEQVQFIDLPERASAQEELVLRSIEFPLTLKFGLSTKNDHKVYLIAGTSLNYNLKLNATQSLSYSDGSIFEFNNREPFPRFNTSALLGLTLERKTSNSYTWVLQPMIQFTQNEFDFVYGKNAYAFVNIGISTGVLF